MTESTPTGYFIAPYGIDGEQAGFGFRDFSQLSRKWLSVCDDFLNFHGPVFDAPWSGPLHEIRNRFTSAPGVAIGTFFVRDRVATSNLLINGRSPEADQYLTESFVSSLRRIDLVQQAADTPEPFATITSITERPLMVVVAWPDPTISDQEHNLIKELSLHLAGAFFSRKPVTGPGI